MLSPQCQFLERDGRLHLQHGPIDLIIAAYGSQSETQLAYGQAWQRFERILEELVRELPQLRQPCQIGERHFNGTVARRMAAATVPYYQHFITPMAAVAGAVSDEILEALITGRQLQKAYVNNGGDTALYVSAGSQIRAAIHVPGQGLAGTVLIDGKDCVRGLATSGWHGRSHSLGIADSVTVLALSGAAADAAATLVGNAVDLPGHPNIRRTPACEQDPDSDLGMRPVTTDVGWLDKTEIAIALQRGCDKANQFVDDGRIAAAALFLKNERRICTKGKLPRFMVPVEKTDPKEPTFPGSGEVPDMHNTAGQPNV